MERARRALTVTHGARHAGIRRVPAEIGVRGTSSSGYAAASGSTIAGFALAGLLGVSVMWKIMRTPGEL
jgi:hypothetical protein